MQAEVKRLSCTEYIKVEERCFEWTWWVILAVHLVPQEATICGDGGWLPLLARMNNRRNLK